MHVEDCDAGHRAAICGVRQFTAIVELDIFVLKYCTCDHSDDNRGSLVSRAGYSELSREMHGGEGGAAKSERALAAQQMI